MMFELIKNAEGLDMYGDIPCLPWELTSEIGERFVGEETDSWILLEDFVPEIDAICTNVLDYGDVDYFNAEKCRLILNWLIKRKERDMTSRLVELYNCLELYLTKAIELGTGVVIEL